MVIMGFHFLSTKLLASPRYIPILDLHFYSDLVKYVKWEIILSNLSRLNFLKLLSFGHLNSDGCSICNRYDVLHRNVYKQLNVYYVPIFPMNASDSKPRSASIWYNGYPA